MLTSSLVGTLSLSLVTPLSITYSMLVGDVSPKLGLVQNIMLAPALHHKCCKSDSGIELLLFQRYEHSISSSRKFWTLRIAFLPLTTYNFSAHDTQCQRHILNLA